MTKLPRLLAKAGYVTLRPENVGVALGRTNAPDTGGRIATHQTVISCEREERFQNLHELVGFAPRTLQFIA
jgi:hypothetical protein